MISRLNFWKVSSWVTVLIFLAALFVPNVLMLKADATQTVEVVTIAKGTDFATPAYVIKSTNPGPTVLVTGGIHGDEQSGYEAARKIKDWKIARGTMIVIPEANPLAVKNGVRAPAETGDLNRLFPQDGGQAQGPLATAIVNFLKGYQIDWAMDLKEGTDFYKNLDTNSIGQTIIYYPRGTSQSFSEGLVAKLNKGITKSSEQYSVLRWPVKGSLVRYLGDQGAQTFIFAASGKQTLQTRINQHYAAVNHMLSENQMLPGQEVIAPSKNTTQIVTIAPGTQYATPAYIIKSDKPGPTVAVIGGVHGNEIAGYRAAHQVKNFKISKGTLIVIPEAHVIAVREGRREPSITGDLNRLFPQDGGQPKGPLATAIVNFFKNYKVDWAMDLHEGFDFYKNPDTNSVGQTIIYYPRGNSQTFSGDLAKELNKEISKSSEQFSLLRWPVKGSLARYLGDQGVQSFIFETSQKQTLQVRIGQQLTAVNFMLNHLGMLATADQEVPAPAPQPEPLPQPEPTPTPVPGQPGQVEYEDADEIPTEEDLAGEEQEEREQLGDSVEVPVQDEPPIFDEEVPVPTQPSPTVPVTEKTGSSLMPKKTITFEELLRGINRGGNTQPTMPVSTPAPAPAPTPAPVPVTPVPQEPVEETTTKKTFTLSQLISLIFR